MPVASAGGPYTAECERGQASVRLDGTGFWVEMWADAQMVHVTGDLFGLGGLLNGSVATGLQEIVTQALQKRLP
jgi:hypothetical protein